MFWKARRRDATMADIVLSAVLALSPGEGGDGTPKMGEMASNCKWNMNEYDRLCCISYIYTDTYINIYCLYNYEYYDLIYIYIIYTYIYIRIWFGIPIAGCHSPPRGWVMFHAAGSLHRRSLLGRRNQMIPMHRQMFWRFCNRWAGPKGNPVLMAQSELLSQLVLCLIRFRIGIFQGLNHGRGWSAPGLVGSVAFEAKGEVPQLKEAAQIQLWQRNWWQTITYIISQKNPAISGAIGFPECAAIGQKRRSASFFVGSFGFTGWWWFLNQGRNLLYRCWSGVLGGGWLLKGLVEKTFFWTQFFNLWCSGGCSAFDQDLLISW